MSTAFQKTCSAVDSIEGFNIQAASADDHDSSRLLYLWQQQNSISNMISTELGPAIARMKKNAEEKDPVKMLYGPKMLEKVRELLIRYETAFTSFQDASDRLQPLVEKLEREKKEEEERLRQQAEQQALAQKREQEELAARAEADRRREQQEKEERAKAEAERKKQLEEERIAKIEAKKRAEEEAKAAAELEEQRRQAEEQARKQQELERQRQEKETDKRRVAEVLEKKKQLQEQEEEKALAAILEQSKYDYLADSPAPSTPPPRQQNPPTVPSEIQPSESVLSRSAELREPLMEALEALKADCPSPLEYRRAVGIVVHLLRKTVKSRDASCWRFPTKDNQIYADNLSGAGAITLLLLCGWEEVDADHMGCVEPDNELSQAALLVLEPELKQCLSDGTTMQSSSINSNGSNGSDSR